MSSARAFSISPIASNSGDAVDEGLRASRLPRRGLLHLEAVLVHAGDEQLSRPSSRMEALDRVGRDALVGVADMGRAIGVGDRRGDEEAADERPLKQKNLAAATKYRVV